LHQVLLYFQTHCKKCCIFALLNCAAANNDSYWVKLDNSSFVLCNGLITNGWQWKKLTSAELTAGEHTLTIAYCKEGARLDKICITNYKYVPAGMGDTAVNLCVPTPPVGVNLLETTNVYALGKNYPNPFKEKTNISFEIPNDTYVSLKVYNIFGTEIAELAGKKYLAGKHTVKFNSKNLSKGIYFYKMKADKFTTSRKMILLGE
jgi:hypothetical protein